MAEAATGHALMQTPTPSGLVPVGGGRDAGQSKLSVLEVLCMCSGTVPSPWLFPWATQLPPDPTLRRNSTGKLPLFQGPL